MGELPQRIPGPTISHSSLYPVWFHTVRSDREEMEERKTENLKYLREFCEEALGLKESEHRE